MNSAKIIVEWNNGQKFEEVYEDVNIKVDDNKQISSSTSGERHVNESPYNCPCGSNCYCKDHSCKNKKD